MKTLLPTPAESASAGHNELPRGTPHPGRPLLENLRAGRAQVIVAYGTSLTAGGQWVKDLDHWLNQQHPGQCKVINSGLSGRASRTGLARVNELVCTYRPDLVFLEFAVNDASSYPEDDTDHGITLEESRANLHRLIESVLAHRPSAEIVLQTMNPAWDAPNGNQSASRRPRLSDYYASCRHVAAERGLVLLDHYAAWQRLLAEDRETFESYIPDGIHPSAIGSAAVTSSGIVKAFGHSPLP